MEKLVAAIAARVAEEVARQIADRIPDAVDRVAESIIEQIGSTIEVISKSAIEEALNAARQMPFDLLKLLKIR